MKTSRLTKIIAVALILCVLASVLASCGGKTVMTLTADGKTYTLSESEYLLFMKAIKLNVMYSMGATSVYNSILWDYYTTSDGTSYEEYYQDYVKDYATASLVSEYLCEKYGLEISDEDKATAKASIKAANKNYGGAGSYKQYFGYTAADYYNKFVTASERINLLLEYLYTGDNAIDPITDEERETYYNDNYYNYQFIMLDMNNAIARDDNGYIIGLDEDDNEYPVQVVTAEDGTVTIEIVHDVPATEDENTTDEADVDYADDDDTVGETDGLLTTGSDDDLVITTADTEDTEEEDPEIVSFKTVELSEEDVTAKSYYPQAILDKIAEGSTFKDLMLEYSDSILSYTYADGVILHKDGYFVNNETVMDAARALEIDGVSEAISISDGEYYYIVKRIALVDGAYKDEKYEELFSDYEDVVIDAKYEELTTPYTEAIVIDTDTIGKYTMKGIYTAPILDMQSSSDDD